MSLVDLQAEFGTDKKLESEGVWIYPVIRNPKIGFLVRRMSRSNREWANRAAASYRKNKRKIEAGHVTDPKILEDSFKVFCQTVLMNWKGLYDKQKQEIPYTIQKGVELFSTYPDLYERVSDEAQDISTFQAEEIDEIAEKSVHSSTGS